VDVEGAEALREDEMHLCKLLNRGLAAAVFFLAIAPWALAQEYQIVRADYGAGDQRVDVTQRLRDLARDNAVFRMGNSTFGVDPAHGLVKTLRIFARGRDGKIRVFEYREGSTVDGSVFVGWSRGDWGQNRVQQPGQYVILRAYYGIPGRNVDVTQRLHDLARGNAVFRMGNSTFGIDPAHGVVKTLRIFARGPNGDVRMFEYPEGSTVDGSVFSGWARGDWGQGEWHGDWNGEHHR
jgi:predicted aconitase with swiveling domain